MKEQIIRNLDEAVALIDKAYKSVEDIELEKTLSNSNTLITNAIIALESLKTKPEKITFSITSGYDNETIFFKGTREQIEAIKKVFCEYDMINDYSFSILKEEKIVEL